METNQNILFFEPSTGYGGSSRCLLGWLQQLDRSLFNPSVVIYSVGPTIQKIQQAGVKTFQLPYFSLFKEISQRFQGGEIISYVIFFFESLINIVPLTFFSFILIKRGHIKLVACNASIISGIPVIIAAKLSRIPCVVHIHDSRPLTQKEILVAKSVRRFIVLTKTALDIYSPDLTADRLRLVYNGLNLDEWYVAKNEAKIRRDLAIKDDIFVVGMVGRIAKGKGHKDFIEAAQLICQKCKDVIFLIVGESILIDREYEQNMKTLVRKLDLTDRVIFTGWKLNIKEILSIFDILIFPTTTFPEGFGLSCIEAMALSKPVIATDVPGPSEIVINNVTGFLVPPAEPQVLAEKIEYLLTNPDIAMRMGEAGRKRVEEMFDIRKVTRQIEAVYEEVLLENQR